MYIMSSNSNNEKIILYTLKQFGPMPVERLRFFSGLSKSSFYYALKNLIIKKQVEVIKQPMRFGKKIKIKSLVIPKINENSAKS